MAARYLGIYIYRSVVQTEGRCTRLAPVNRSCVNVYFRYVLSHRSRFVRTLSDEGKDERPAGEEGTDVERRRKFQLLFYVCLLIISTDDTFIGCRRKWFRTNFLCLPNRFEVTVFYVK